MILDKKMQLALLSIWVGMELTITHTFLVIGTTSIVMIALIVLNVIFQEPKVRLIHQFESYFMQGFYEVMARRMNMNDHTRHLNYSFVKGIDDKLYTMGYGKHDYYVAKALCEYPNVYRGKLFNPQTRKEAILISTHFSLHLPFWVEKETFNDNCTAIHNVSTLYYTF